MYGYFSGVKDAGIDYKKLYETSQKSLQSTQEKLKSEQEKLIKKEEHIEKLNFELDKFRKYLFGRKSEKLSSIQVDVSQTNLFDMSTPIEDQEALSEEAVTVPAKKQPKKRAKGTGRMPLPETLRRETIIIEPKEDVSDCVKIGEEVTEVLDIKPAELFVKRYERPKYAKADKSGILIGQLPERVIEKGIPSNQLLAEISIDKYVYAMPLHRQTKKYQRLGVNIPASSISDWVIKGWKHLAPLWELMKLLIAQQKYLQADETPFKVQDKNHKNGIHQGYMWVYHAPVDGLVFFDYRKGRSSSGPSDILSTFEGILQSDGYAVYESLYGKSSSVMLVFCMAHARRKFVEARNYDKEKADYVLAQIALLYKIEEEMRVDGYSWEQRTEKRQKEAVPVLEKIKNWMSEHAFKVAPKSPLGKAIQYTLSRWAGLSVYAMHGQVEIDNNLVENAIRPLAIGRKNYLFAGSHDAADMTAAMYSFMSTCKKNNINEIEWLTDVFDRIQSHKQKDLYQLLPNNWTPKS